MVKLVDVARAAGVSTATASRALNDNPVVAPESVRRVREAAERLGYRPNAVARSLRTRSSDVIALIIPDVGNNFCTAVTRGVEDVARAAGLSLLLCNSDEDSVKEAGYLRVVEAEKVAGLLLCPHEASADISALLREGVPVVAVDRRLDANVDSVTTTSFSGAHEATSHLLDQGWRSPACCAGPEEIRTAIDRADGYRAAVTERGGEPLVARGTYDQAGGETATAALLEGINPPDALFVSNEQMALGALKAVQRRGLRPGIDIGIAAFDDTPWAPLIETPMTVVEQPAYDLGVQAATLLVERIRGLLPPETRHVVLPTRLVVRRSSLYLAPA